MANSLLDRYRDKLHDDLMDGGFFSEDERYTKLPEFLDRIIKSSTEFVEEELTDFIKYTL